MLSDLMHKKRMGIPFLSLILAYCCILVSTTTYFNPQYYDIFGGEGPVFYKWQYLTSYLEHGSSISYIGTLNPLLQLLLNVVIILTLGVVCERVLGTKRYLLLIFASIIVSQLVRLIFNIWNSGASSIIWSFTPIVFLCLLHLYKGNRKKILKDPAFYFSLALLITMWIVITIVNIVNGWHTLNLVHFLSTLVGVTFAYVWQEYIYKRIEYILNTDIFINKDIVDKGISAISLTAPLFIIGVFILSLSSALTEHVSPVNIVEIYPSSGTIEDISNADNRIIIRFSEDMDTSQIYSDIDCISDAGTNDISNDLVWTDDRTIEIRFDRSLRQEEHISVLLQGLRDTESKGFYEVIKLDYGNDID